MLDVIGLGHCTIDYMSVLDRIPGVDEAVRSRDDSMQMGGPVAIALVAFSHLGGKAGFVGKIGDDEGGRVISKAFSSFGIDTEHLVIDSESKTTTCLILVEKSTGKRSIVVNPHASYELDAETFDPSCLAGTRFLHLDGASLPAAHKAADWARDHDIKVVIDPGPFSEAKIELIRKSNVVIAPRAFCEEGLGSRNIREGAKALAQLGPEIVVVTDGAHGCVALTGNQCIDQPAFSVKAVDTTGAGDVFHGAFLFGLVQDWDLKRILQFSAATAALKCTKVGGYRGTPDRAQVEAFLVAGNPAIRAM